MKIKSKKASLFFTSCALTLSLCLGGCSLSAGQDQNYAQNGNIFDNQKFAQLVDESYKKVLEDGYYELRVPKSIHGVSTDNFPSGAKIVSQRLRDNGYQAYYVGGAIRDSVMGLNSNDVDIATNAPNSVIKTMFKDMNVKFHDVGEMTFAFLSYQGEPVDIATFYNIPKELHGTAGIPQFNPDEVHTDSVLNDSFRRDFAFNAFYYDSITDEIIDNHGGFYSIKNRIIKPIGDPYVTMKMDNSRVIRGLRFKARYGFDFSPELEQYLRKDFDRSLKNFNPLDASMQLKTMFNRGNAQKNVAVLYDYDLFGAFFRPIRPFAKRPSYKEYVNNFAKLLDERSAVGPQLPDEVYLAGILWPAVEIEAKRYSIDKAIGKVTTLQSKYFTFEPKVREDLIALLELEYKLGNAGYDDEDLRSSHFDDALLILKARALKDKKLDVIIKKLEKQDGGYQKAA